MPFARLDAAGIDTCFLTLHVGAGTFLPVKTDDTRSGGPNTSIEDLFKGMMLFATSDSIILVELDIPYFPIYSRSGIGPKTWDPKIVIGDAPVEEAEDEPPILVLTEPAVELETGIADDDESAFTPDLRSAIEEAGYQAEASASEAPAEDAADALAVALCHHHTRHTLDNMAGRGP